MYKSNELVMQCIYVTVVVVVVAKSDLAYAIGVLRNGKVRCLVYTYLLLYTYIHVTTPQVLRLQSAMNLSDYISHNSLYFYNTYIQSYSEKTPVMNLFPNHPLVRRRGYQCSIVFQHLYKAENTYPQQP